MSFSRGIKSRNKIQVQSNLDYPDFFLWSQFFMNIN